MKNFWFRLLTRSAYIFGPWLFILVARIIASGFFLFSARVAESRRFYAALFPDKGPLSHLYYSFRQYQNFTTIHLDRFLSNKQIPSSSSEGLEKLEAALKDKGAILLMSHLGNWEMAAQLLKKEHSELPMLLYMGSKEKEGLEKIQKESLRRSGVKIIGVAQEDSSPFSALEGIHFLQEGGLVSLSGDMLWRSDQRALEVSFLGHTARVPEAPYVFALVSGAPLFAFFSFRSGRNSYHFTLSEPIIIPRVRREERKKVIAEAAQQYANLLEEALRSHPFEWYHFERFIYQKPEDRGQKSD